MPRYTPKRNLYWNQKTYGKKAYVPKQTTNKADARVDMKAVHKSSILDMFKSKVKNFGTNFTKNLKSEWGPDTKKVRYGKAFGGKVAAGGKTLGSSLLGLAKKGVHAYRKTPRLLKGGGLAAGAVAMLGIGILKGAFNESNEIAYERYMEDMYTTKDILNTSRLGLASGTSRMQNYGSTMGLSNALSRTRHGR